MMKRMTKCLCLLMATVSALSVFGGCKGYQEDYTYTAIHPGSIAEPTVSRDNPTFRDLYPTMEHMKKP